MKLCLVGAELLHADGRTVGRDKANSCFLQFLKHFGVLV